MQAEESEMEKSDNQSEANETSPGERQNKRENIGNQTSVWEWIFAFIGLALVVGAIGFMLYEALWESESPPDIKVQVESINEISSGYLVKFRAVNQGGATASEVMIEAELKRGEEKVETSQTTVDFLPARSTRKGGFFFKHDPRQFDLQIRPVGYRQP